MTRLALFILLTAACGDVGQVEHYAFGLATGEYRAITCEGDTLALGQAGPAGDVAFAVWGCVYPVRIERTGD